LRSFGLFGAPPIWVAGTAALVQRVAAGLRERRHRVHLATPEDLGRLAPGTCQTLILADPPDPAGLVDALRGHLSLHPRRGRARVPLRLILMHQADPAPPLPELDPAGPLRLETFAIEDQAARVVLRRWPLHFGLDPLFDQRPHLLAIGFAPPARAILVQALRLIAYGEGRPRITVATDDPGIRATFDRDYPQAGQVADLRWIGLDLPGLALAPPVTQVLVCPDPALDESATAALTRGIVRRLAAEQGVSPPLLLSFVGGDGADPADRQPSGTLSDWDGQTFPFSYLDEACRPEVLLEGRGDELAQTIHEHYTDSIAAQGRDPDGEPAGRPWSRLAATYRDANRHQADHLWAKLAVMDCRAVPEDQVDAFTFAPLEAERLAVIEHLRWSADRHLDGWSYAPERNNARRHHPLLIPYPGLSEPMKDLDRFAVRGVPTLLARFGLGVVRMLILGIAPGARPVGSGGALRGLAERALERLTTRYPDRTLVVASTLADPAARCVARLALEQTGAGLFLLLPRPITATLAEQPTEAERLDLLGLVARAERRISLPEPGEVARWFARRVEIKLVLGTEATPGGVPKRLLLDPARRRTDWNFEY
jgi:hypothetical protein